MRVGLGDGDGGGPRKSYPDHTPRSSQISGPHIPHIQVGLAQLQPLTIPARVLPLGRDRDVGTLYWSIPRSFAVVRQQFVRSGPTDAADDAAPADADQDADEPADEPGDEGPSATDRRADERARSPDRSRRRLLEAHDAPSDVSASRQHEGAVADPPPPAQT